MKVLILTSPEYFNFVCDLVSSVSGEFKIYQGRIENIPEGYDIGISFMYQYKVPAKQVNTHPWFNFHPGPLPEYKGRDLCYHAIMNGEREFGATIHYMDEGFDTGDIIEVRRFPVKDCWTSEDLSAVAIVYSKQLFMDYFPKILETRVFPRIPNRGGTYHKKGKIIDTIPVKADEPLGQFVRAVTYKQFYPRIDIAGVKYKIVREE